MGTISRLFEENKFTEDDIASFEKKVFFEGDRRRQPSHRYQASRSCSRLVECDTVLVLVLVPVTQGSRRHGLSGVGCIIAPLPSRI